MKLLTKTTLYFLCAILPLLAAGGFLLFQQFSKQINERADKELIYEELQWIQYLESNTSPASNYTLQSPNLLIYPVRKEPTRYPTISSHYGTLPKENLRLPFRQLEHVVDIHGVPYQIVIRKSQEQKLALQKSVTTIMLLVFAGILIATMLFNWIISKKLWQPFRASLQKIRNLELQQMEAMHFGESKIQEFNELNASLDTMTRKIHQDYLNMKEFTENAAHEMQTPLAIAQTKLELLLQDPGLNEQQVATIAQTTEALSRLSKLNQSLLLLAKIENNQYEASGVVNLTEVTQKYLRLFDEIIKDKQLQVHMQVIGNFECRVHPFLADSLVSNLVGNAIKYNIARGQIRIEISESQYCITNISDAPALPPEALFQRFSGSPDKENSSTGLGLAIVKKIADTNHLLVRYDYENERHRFCLMHKNR